MGYRENVSALAKKRGITNSPGLKEEDLGISRLEFFDHDDQVTVIHATEMNKGARLFLETVWDEAFRPFSLWMDGTIEARAMHYFAELWEDHPEPGKRSLLDALRTAKYFVVYRKSH
jgi:hypothetical protein